MLLGPLKKILKIWHGDFSTIFFFQLSKLIFLGYCEYSLPKNKLVVCIFTFCTLTQYHVAIELAKQIFGNGGEM